MAYFRRLVLSESETQKRGCKSCLCWVSLHSTQLTRLSIIGFAATFVLYLAPKVGGGGVEGGGQWAEGSREIGEIASIPQGLPPDFLHSGA